MAQPQHLVLARAEQALARGRTDVAVSLCQSLLVRTPHAGAHHLLGLIAAKAGDFAGAEQQFRAALRLEPGNVDALGNLGNVLHQLGEKQQALACYDQALARRPDFVTAWFNRGRVLQLLGRLEEALESYARLDALRPGEPLVLAERGKLLLQLKRYGEAEPVLAAAVQADPSLCEAWSNHGAALHAQGQMEAALACYDAALALKPDMPALHCNRGSALYALRRLDEAMAAYEQAIALDPAYADAISNKGNVLMQQQRPDLALQWYDRALALRPDLAPSICSNRANALAELERPQEALAAFAEALAADPEYAVAHNNEGLHRLLLGDFATGWAKTRWRWQANGRPDPAAQFPQPMWDGSQPIAGRRLLITAEQGLGDVIQFGRYARLLAAQGAVVFLQAPRALKRLLRGLAHVDLVVEPGAPPPEFDLHCPLLDLPELLGTRLETIPAEVPYLRAPRHLAAHWDRRLGRPGEMRIGFVWCGNPEHTSDHKRSMPLSALLPLLAMDAHFVCLQKQIGAADRALLAAAAPQVSVPADEITDFADTAGIVESLDLVVSVDTSVAHLAGALARPVWVMLPLVPDWRWLLQREDSPWYPTARLFRQRQRGDWGGVVADVAAAVEGRKKAFLF